MTPNTVHVAQRVLFCFLQLFHRIIKSFRLEKTFKIEFNHKAKQLCGLREHLVTRYT